MPKPSRIFHVAFFQKKVKYVITVTASDAKDAIRWVREDYPRAKIESVTQGV